MFSIISELNHIINSNNCSNIGNSIDDQLVSHNRLMHTKPKPSCDIINGNISNHTGTHGNINDATELNTGENKIDKLSEGSRINDKIIEANNLDVSGGFQLEKIFGQRTRP